MAGATRGGSDHPARPLLLSTVDYRLSTSPRARLLEPLPSPTFTPRKATGAEACHRVLHRHGAARDPTNPCRFRGKGRTGSSGWGDDPEQFAVVDEDQVADASDRAQDEQEPTEKWYVKCLQIPFMLASFCASSIVVAVGKFSRRIHVARSERRTMIASPFR